MNTPTYTYINEDRYYTTANYVLAATISMFYAPEAVERRKGQPTVFIFTRRRQLDELIEEFWSGELRIEPRSFYTYVESFKKHNSIRHV